MTVVPLWTGEQADTHSVMSVGIALDKIKREKAGGVYIHELAEWAHKLVQNPQQPCPDGLFSEKYRSHGLLTEDGALLPDYARAIRASVLKEDEVYARFVVPLTGLDRRTFDDVTTELTP